MIPLFVSVAAAAPPCDAAALAADVERASAIHLPAAFVALSECDAERARRLAPAAVPRMFGDPEEHPAVLAMVRIGADDTLIPWLSRLTPDARLGGLHEIGLRCTESPVYDAFFATLHDRLGESFFRDRWHRGLDDCFTPGAAALLDGALSGDRFGPGSQDRGAFLDILEVYAANRRVEALPLLERYATDLHDPEEIAYVLQILPRAVGFDTVEGVDADQAAVAAEVILRLAPRFDADRVDLARIALQRIEQPTAEGQLSRHRWPDAWRVGGGRYTYAVTAEERTVCPNGKVLRTLHFGTFNEGGELWPEPLAAAAGARVSAEWGLGAAASCGATPTVTVRTSETPLKLDSDRDAWLAPRRAEALVKQKGVKTAVVEHETFLW